MDLAIQGPPDMYESSGETCTNDTDCVFDPDNDKTLDFLTYEIIPAGEERCWGNPKRCYGVNTLRDIHPHAGNIKLDPQSRRKVYFDEPDDAPAPELSDEEDGGVRLFHKLREDPNYDYVPCTTSKECGDTERCCEFTNPKTLLKRCYSKTRDRKLACRKYWYPSKGSPGDDERERALMDRVRAYIESVASTRGLTTEKDKADIFRSLVTQFRHAMPERRRITAEQAYAAWVDAI